MANPDFKNDIKRYYNEEAALRNSKTEKSQWKKAVRENFCNFIKAEGKKTLLEIGAGAGYDSVYFKENGLSATCVDISGEMVKACKEKGLTAFELDYYSLSSLGMKFDCVYAINTLLHVPKSDFPTVLCEIKSVLNPDGLFYMGLYGGDDTESEFVKSEVSSAPRLFAFYSAKYLKSVLCKCFDIISFETLDVGDDSEKIIFHSVILRKI